MPTTSKRRLLIQEGLASYVVDYLDGTNLPKSDSATFLPFMSLCIGTKAKLEGVSLKYYEFERELRLILTALRAKRSGKDIIRELQFEDPTDPLVADILAQKDARRLRPAAENSKT